MALEKRPKLGDRHEGGRGSQRRVDPAKAMHGVERVTIEPAQEAFHSIEVVEPAFALLFEGLRGRDAARNDLGMPSHLVDERQGHGDGHASLRHAFLERAPG